MVCEMPVLSSSRGTMACCVWRRGPRDTEDNCQYIWNRTGTDSREGETLQLGVGRGRGEQTSTVKNLNFHEILSVGSGQDRFFGTSQAPENGRKIWNVECYDPLQDRFIVDGSRGVKKYKLGLVGVQNVRWEKGGNERAGICTFIYAERKKN